MWKNLPHLCFLLLVFLWKPPRGCGQETPQPEFRDGAIVDPDKGDLKDDVIPIGGLFENTEYELVFRAAVDIVNEDSNINLEQDLEPVVETLPEDDSYEAVRDACHLLHRGVAAIVGPTSPVSSLHVSSVCDSLNVPHMETHWDPFMEGTDDSFNLSPHPKDMAEAYTALMRYWEWKDVAIVYEEDDDVVDLKDFLQEIREDAIEVSFFFRNETTSYRDVLTNIRESGVNNIFVAIDDEGIEVFLKQAMQIDMLSEEFSYLFSSLDFHVADLSDFIYSKANITALRIVDVDDAVAGIFEEKIEELEAANTASPADVANNDADTKEDYEGDDDDNVQFPRKIPTAHALLYDAVKLFALSVRKWNGGQSVTFPPTNCRDENPEDDHKGSVLKEIMKQVQFDGLTGTVDFDENGFRTNFELDITELGEDGLETIGTWSPASGLNITADESQDGEEREKLRVVTTLTDPFVMEHEVEGVKTFSGFCVDLVNELASRLSYEVELYVVPDGKHGSVDEHGRWTGMIGEILNGSADLAVGDITITEERDRAVDFTLPFMMTGLAVLTKDSEPSNPGGIWSFFLPLTREVWVYLLIAMACTTFVMYISARLSFGEWGLVENVKGEDTMENRFSLYNSFLFVLTTMVHQRMNLDPSATATRALAGFWYFFTFIILAIVVTNLCECMLWEDDGVDYRTVQDVLKAKGFTYIAVKDGSTRKFLENSKVPLHQKLHSLLERNYRNLPVNVAEGLKQVKEDRVAFVMEHASAMYAVQHDCNFSRTYPFIYHSAYAIATPRGSPYRNRISVEILRLQETGRLQWMQQLWWNELRYCADDDDDGDAGGDASDEDDRGREEKVEIRQLNGTDLAGAFALLYIGLIVASILAVVELFYVFSTRAKRETHLNSIAVSDHIKQAGFIWKRSMDLSDLRM